jgi:hypothetical protein
MSKIALTPNASGSGTFTIAAPNSNTDRTLTLPDEAGTVLTSGGAIYNQALKQPTFSVRRNGDQTGVSSSSFNKVQLNAVEWDTDNGWDSVNYRYTFPVQGYYLITAQLRFSGSSISRELISIWKNGSEAHRGLDLNMDTNTITTSVTLWGNTSTYIELYGYGIGSSLAFDDAGLAETCRLSITMLRSDT